MTGHTRRRVGEGVSRACNCSRKLGVCSKRYLNLKECFREKSSFVCVGRKRLSVRECVCGWVAAAAAEYSED